MTRLSTRNRWSLVLVAASLLLFTSTVNGHPRGEEDAGQTSTKRSKQKEQKGKSCAKQVSAALKDLVKLSESLETLGYAEEIAAIQSTIVKLDVLLVDLQTKEAEKEARENKQKIALYRAAIDAHSSAGQTEEASLLERAVAYLEVSGRKDDEAKAIRKQNPKKQIRAILLTEAAEQLRATGDAQTAKEIASFASTLSKNQRNNGESSSRSDKKAKQSESESQPEKSAEVSSGKNNKQKRAKNDSKKGKKSRGRKQNKESDEFVTTENEI